LLIQKKNIPIARATEDHGCIYILKIHIIIVIRGVSMHQCQRFGSHCPICIRKGNVPRPMSMAREAIERERE